MKKIFFIQLIVCVIYSCASTKGPNGKTRYFDLDNVEINKAKFDGLCLKENLTYYLNDSLNYKKICSREKHGRIANRPLLDSLLEKRLKIKLYPNNPLVIVYYPGKDFCNGGMEHKGWVDWFEQLEDGLSRIAQIEPVYICKKELEGYNGVIKWNKDPGGIIELTFFQHHYPCISFVVISENGNYVSYFGEFAKEQVWNVTQFMKK